MKKNTGLFTLKAVTFAMALAQTSTAFATNGYFLPGSGWRSQGMGGVGIAYGRDTLSIAANPANIVNIGMRGDMGFAIFNAERYAGVGRSAGQNSPFGFNSSSESDAKYFIVPEMGVSMPLTESVYAGFAVIGAGLGTNYPGNFFSIKIGNTTHQRRDEPIGVEMFQMQIPLTLGYKLNETHSFGAALMLAATRFRAYGLGAFQGFDEPPPNGFDFPITSDPAHLTDQGFDYSYGAGFKLGWLGSFMEDKVTLGLAYTSRAYMTKFDKYRGLFAEQGDFDIPENYGIGIAIKPMKNLVVAADIFRINYADIPAIGNRGPGTVVGTYDSTTAPSGVPSIANSIYELGNDQGMGFGWTNMTVYKLGMQYGVNQRLQLRAGLNYGESPIPDDQITFNTLAPATVERHYSVGFTYRASDVLEVTGTYMYVASNSQHSPPNQNVVGQAEINMHQNLFAISLGWVLDPGPVSLGEYGDEDWDGINFDGWYAGFSFGQSRYQDIAESLDAEQDALGKTSSTSANTRSEGWKVYLGYQFNNYLGIEGGYANLNDMTANTAITAPAPAPRNILTNTASEAWTLAAVGAYPVTDKFSVTAKLGAAYVLTNTFTRLSGTSVTPIQGQGVHSGEDSYEPLYGVGVNYALLENFVNLRAEWERFDLDDHDIDLITAGFSVEF
jgi:long-chain fatty acid transport protein